MLIPETERLYKIFKDVFLYLRLKNDSSKTKNQSAS